MSAIVNYLDFITWHTEATGTGGLPDSVGSRPWSELGTVASVPDGKFGAGRGPCSGVWNTGGDGFEITPTVEFETRHGSGFRRGTQLGWCRLDTETGDNEFSSQAQASLGNAFQQYMVRANHQLDGGTNAAPVIFIWDHTLNNFAFASGAGRGSAGLMPTNTWFLIGWSIDLDTDTLRFFNGIPGEPTYFIELDMSSILPFRATLVGSALLGVGSGHSGTLGLDGDIDHVDWYFGTMFDEQDFLFFWNNGAGRSFPDGYIVGGDDADYNYYWKQRLQAS